MRDHLKTTIFAALVVAVFAFPATAADKITIGYGFTSDTLTAHVAAEEKIFQKHGIEPTLKPIRGASNMIAGVVSDNLQVIMSNPVQFLTAVHGGIDLMVLAGGATVNRANDNVALLVHSDFNYALPSDLIGKKIGVTGFNSGTYFVIKRWLRQKGIDDTKIQFVEGSVPRMGDLLKSKRVDAVTSIEPFTSRIRRDGFGKLAEKYYTESLPDDQANIFWAATRKWITANPSIAKRYRAALVEAAAFIEKNPARAREIEKAKFRGNKFSLPNSSIVVKEGILKTFYQMGVEIGHFSRPVDFSKLIYKE